MAGKDETRIVTFEYSVKAYKQCQKLAAALDTNFSQVARAQLDAWKKKQIVRLKKQKASK